MTRLLINVVVPGLEFDGRSLTEKSLGGSETAGLCVARELAKIGDKVTVFCNTKRDEDIDGVAYVPVEMAKRACYLIPHDVCLVQRLPELFAMQTQAKLNILWQHDMALGRMKAGFSGALWNIDKVLLLSDFHIRQYQEVYGVEPNILHQTRNGIDLDLFPEPNTLPRDRHQLIYAARPERGLDVLLEDIFPELLKRDSRFTLAIASYKNPVEHMRGFYGKIDDLIRSYGDRVLWLGNLNKPQLYQAFARAGLYVYPTPSKIMPEFREISCISAMECQAAGLPFVGTRSGALPETCAAIDKASGGLCLVEPGPDYVNRFCDAVMLLTHDEESDLYGQISKAGIEHAQTLGWNKVAEDLHSLFEREVGEGNPIGNRLANHLWERSDIMALQTLVDYSSALDDKWPAILKGNYGFIENKESFVAHYAKIGETHTDGFDMAGASPRFEAIKRLVGMAKDCKAILDAGCGQSEYIIHLSNAFPEIRFVGADIDPSIEKWHARHVELGRAKYPQNTRVLRTDTINSDTVPSDFDCAIACEVLEHVPKPWEWLQGVESCVRPGGAIILTVPFGPWEHMSYDTYPHRCHLWEFSVQDLEDMLGKKQGFAIQALNQGVSDKTGDVIGWYFIRYYADHKPIGQIDMKRKLWLQRPRQMVSAAIIAGPKCELTLGWCLESIRGVCQEIIIGDCGLSSEAREIAGCYGALIVEARNPLEHGFDEARNDVIKHCKHDWILWIDTDEKLLDPVYLNKYLRSNRYNGYGIRQHHFAVDQEYKPDMPCRLFRNRKGIRFWGSIHEHPETEVNKGPGETIVISDVHIAHIGYLNESARKKRFWRNLPLVEMDKKKNPNRLLQKHFICRDNMILAAEILGRNGGVITEDIRKLCNEVVEIFREHFLGKPSYVNVDTLPYYSQACKILDVGVDVRFTVEAAREGIGDPVNGAGIRFATVEDAMEEIRGKSKALIEPLMRQGW